MKERKQTKQTTSIPRGHRFNTSRTDATMPAQHNPFSMAFPLDHQSNVGAYQKRQWPSDCATA